jgi:hypothetical protein
MADPRHADVIAKGVKSWNEWRLTANKSESDFNLSEAQLVGADLRRGDFRRVNLARADLHRANLKRAVLVDANLRGANPGNAYLGEANLSGVNLSFANLHAANLRKADLSKANLSGADLSGAYLGLAYFGEAYLGAANLAQARLDATVLAATTLIGAKGLDSCIHDGPSSIGIDTFFRSDGIPASFLRGCGVPEQFITYARSLVAEYHSCFISYSSINREFAERLYADLMTKHVHCWYAPEELKIGERFEESIEKSIGLFDKVMIVLSQASVESRWVEREVNAAREREAFEKRDVLFPIRIDDAIMNAPQPWAAEIRRTRHIGDFSAWRVDSLYQTAFQRLLRDLQVTDRAAPAAATGMPR